MACAAAAALTVGLTILSQPSVRAEAGERSLTIFNTHTKETVSVVFKRGGRYVAAGLEALNQIMRDHRRNEATKMDPELFDLLWQVYNEVGSKAPIHLISGYRSGATNEMLRKNVGGQANKSRHILGKAADVHFPDVPVKQLRYSALIQERGGVGYYPTSAIPFVHLDTDRVRSWPRLPRHELALLFPSGSTQHAPAEGGPITREDVRTAKAGHSQLAQQIAMFLGSRGSQGTPFAIADARSGNSGSSQQAQRVAALPPGIRPAPASLVERPQLANRPESMPTPLRASFTPNAADRARLAELVNLAASIPKLISGPVPASRPETQRLPSLTGIALPAPPSTGRNDRNVQSGHLLASLGPTSLPDLPLRDEPGLDQSGWISAPAYDEEHPEELSYRPFPITPYLTDAAEQPLLGELVAHDIRRTLELLDHPDATATLKFRPAAHATAALLTPKRFSGAAIKLDGIDQSTPLSSAADAPDQSQRTSQR